jgi:hypothetical protein
MAIDSEIRAIQFDSKDALCLDGKRLVVISQNADVAEYRTLPDTQFKVIGHLSKNEVVYFEAFLPTGWVIEYGKTAGSRPLALGGVPRAWLATEMRDARGNTMTYGYCFAEADGYTAEYAVDEIKYTQFEGDASVEATRAVAFVYGVKEDRDLFGRNAIAAVVASKRASNACGKCARSALPIPIREKRNDGAHAANVA